MISWGCCFFFCKQKTAYEMRISDWSSDVCSSDLVTVSFVPASDSRVAGSVVGRAHVNSRWSWGSPNAWISHADVVFDRDDLSRAAPTNGAGGTSSEERRVGTECVSTCRSRWSTYH